MTDEHRALIASDPQVLHGQVHVKGTRVPVRMVLDCLAAGMSEAGIVGEYPTLTTRGVRPDALSGHSHIAAICGSWRYPAASSADPTGW